MTLVATAISKHGIINAAVPGLTSYPAHANAGRRIFRLGFANAALAVTGRYEVGARPLDEWVAATVRDYVRAHRRPSVCGLAEALKEALTANDDPAHRRMVHLSGYESDRDRMHPVHFFIRNFRGLTRDGGYDKARREFVATEEFWARDFRDEQTIETVGSGGAHLYLNGFPEGRIAYLVLNQRMLDLYRQLWGSSDRFRVPRSLTELATLLELDMRLTLALLGQPGDLNQPAGRRSDGVEIELIPAPPNAVNLSQPAKPAARRRRSGP